MKILLSAYSINPTNGSEDAVGWNWLLKLSEKFTSPDDEIWVITKKFNEEDTRAGIEKAGLKNVRLVIVDVPPCLNWFREKYSVFHHMYYILWQRVAYVWAKKSGIKFDIIHHVSMGNFRITGFMYRFNDSYTIFGPVGGGQTTPKSLRSYYSLNHRLYESFRDLTTFFMVHSSAYSRRLRGFSAVYGVNDETCEKMSAASKRECQRICDISVAHTMENLNINHKAEGKVEFLYLGRLIELKGLMFLLDAVANVSADAHFHVSVYGEGPLEPLLRAKIREYGLESKVAVCKPVPYNQVSELYKNADAFVHPTFRDSSGAVFVEAMCHALPIIALKNSIANELDENGCGIFVNPGVSRSEAVNNFASAIEKLVQEPKLRLSLGRKAYNYANTQLTMEVKFNIIYGKYLNLREFNERNN